LKSTSALSLEKISSEHSAPQRFAIVNGDDFGFSTGVNQAIFKAHTDGVLTSTSLMVTGGDGRTRRYADNLP
jgi:hypothetical protein